MKAGDRSYTIIETPEPRQLEVLGLVASGYRQSEIADTLGISTHTVKNHLYKLYQLIGAASAPHAYRLCLEKGYLQMADIDEVVT